ncbi:MAG: hypothetical protein HY770_07270 [Chitinivibrionia bacterium]|nr:hypothetical protein [Chitinivibrionia bacterium]
MLLLSPASALAAEFSFPLTWNGRGWVFRYSPTDTVFFMDGGLEANITVAAWDGDEVDGAFYAGAGFTVKMGWQNGGLVVFDPREAHYSIRSGLRLEFSGILATAEMLHDCIHDVDRYDGATPIWNVARFGVSSRSWLPRHRRELWSLRAGRGRLTEIDWRAELWLFPRVDIYEWVQHDHDLSFALGGGLIAALYHWSDSALELRPDALLFLETDNKWSRRVNMLVYMTRYGSDGTASLFAGHVWDNQPLTPSGSRWVFGLDFEL